MDRAASRFTVFLALLAFLIFSVFIGGLLWIFAFGPALPIGLGWFVFSYAAGLSMIVLPCTLPLAFVIVPLAMGKGPVRGFGMALAFSAGVSITLSFYGVLAAVAGNVIIGTLDAPLEAVKNWLYALAGGAAFIFALGELGLLRVRMPSYLGAAPAFIQKQQEYLKALFLGLFLGNIGVGCPHPATPVILTRIAGEGDIFYGWLLFFIHALGRIAPLILLAILGILGVNALNFILKHKAAVERFIGWTMVYVAGFIFVLGFFTHDWWVFSGTHSLLEQITQEERLIGILAGRFQVSAPHIHSLEELEGKTGLLGAPLWLGSWVLVFLWLAPLWWYWWKQKKAAEKITDDKERVQQKNILAMSAKFYLTFSILVGLLFLYTIPHWFQAHQALEPEEAPAFGLVVRPLEFQSGTPQDIVIELKDEKGKPLTGLEISHERLVHVVIVSEDLETIGHVHPEDFGPITEEMRAQARFPVRYTFPKANQEYLVAVDSFRLKHEVSLTTRVRTSGSAPLPAVVKDFSREKIFDGYEVSLRIDPEHVKSGEKIHLTYRFEKNGKPIYDLEPYLGATAHLSIVSADLGTFIHTHGDVPKIASLPFISQIYANGVDHADHEAEIPSSFGPEVVAQVVFPHPGLYAIFAEFKHQGRVVVTKFMLQVAPGEAGVAPAHTH